MRGGTGCAEHASSEDGPVDHQLCFVDGHCVPLVGTAQGPSLHWAEQSCQGTAGGSEVVLATGCLWESNLLCL